MLPDSQLQKFLRDGFVAGSQILDDQAVDELRAELDRVVRDQGTDRPQPVMISNLSRNEASPVWQIVNIWQASPSFRKLVDNPIIAAEVAQLLGDTEVRLWHDQIQYKPAGTGGVNHWHQDSPYWPVLMPKDTQVTAWIALDDVDESNGAMSMVPGSQAWGVNIDFLHSLKSDALAEMPAEFAGHPITVKRCPVRKGAVHYHHPLTWHGSAANTSARPRRAVALHFMSSATYYVRGAGKHPMEEFISVAEGEKIAGEYFPLLQTPRVPATV